MSNHATQSGSKRRRMDSGLPISRTFKRRTRVTRDQRGGGRSATDAASIVSTLAYRHPQLKYRTAVHGERVVATGRVSDSTMKTHSGSSQQAVVLGLQADASDTNGGTPFTTPRFANGTSRAWRDGLTRVDVPRTASPNGCSGKRPRLRVVPAAGRAARRMAGDAGRDAAVPGALRPRRASPRDGRPAISIAVNRSTRA